VRCLNSSGGNTRGNTSGAGIVAQRLYVALCSCELEGAGVCCSIRERRPCWTVKETVHFGNEAVLLQIAECVKRGLVPVKEHDRCVRMGQTLHHVREMPVQVGTHGTWRSVLRLLVNVNASGSSSRDAGSVPITTPNSTSS